MIHLSTSKQVHEMCLDILIKKRTIFILAVFMSIRLAAQIQSDNLSPESTQILEYNLDSNSPSPTLPFDQYFNIALSSESNSLLPIFSVFEMTVITIGGEKIRVPVRFKKIAKCNLNYDRELGLHEKDSIKINEARIRYKKCQDQYAKSVRANSREISADQNGQLVFNPKTKKYIASIAPLLPNKQYEIVVYRKPNDKNLTALYEVISAIRSDQDDVISLFNSKILSFESEENRQLQIFGIQKLDTLEYLTENKFDSILTAVENTKQKISNVQIAPSDLNYVGLKFIKNDIDPTDFRNVFFDFLNLNNGQARINKNIQGLSVFGNSEVASSFDINLQYNNLKKNIAVLSKVETNLKTLLVTDGDYVTQNFYKTYFLALQQEMNKNLEILKTANNSIVTELNKNYSSSELLSVSTGAKDVAIRNAQYLVTDFGITNSIAIDANGDPNYIGRPHFGINWHWGGIDKNQNLRHIADKRFWLRWSIAIGVTLGSIDEDGFSDLFSNVTPTLGMNYRISNQVRLGGGALFLQEKNANPVIDKKSLALAPYLSISFDLSIFETIGKFAAKSFK